ncbi:glycoside hydrolase family 32 protein [soil metagenome]
MKRKYLLLMVCTLLYSCSPSPQGGEQTVPEGGQPTAGTFDEPHRPQFHFTPPAKWMNDPNGMVYHNGEYHLFYQHNPDTTVWAPMHWGHAVSRNMVHWEHLPIALYPDRLGMIFSGSAVVDHGNTAGFGSAGNPAMVAIYTYHDMEGERAGRNDYQSQGIAYSLDNGRSWTTYANNPVLKSPGIRDFRDPKVSWYEEGQKWVMALAVADKISFYSSPNLKDWKKESDFGGGAIGAYGGVWECPDLFKLRVEGTDQEKWVLLVSINQGGPNRGSATQYFIGDFDGNKFVLDEQFKKDLRTLTGIAKNVKGQEGIWIDYGRDNYAGVTWANVPKEDGRRLFMGWMSNWNYANVVPTEAWRSAMTLPRTLTLQNTPAGLRLVSLPVKETDTLVAATHAVPAQMVSASLNLSESLPAPTATFRLNLELESAQAGSGFVIELSNAQNQKMLIGYDPQQQRYYTDRTQAGNHDFSDQFASVNYAPRLATGSTYSLQLWVDVASVELFADGGQTVMTDIFFPDEPFTQVRLIPKDGQVKLKSGEIAELKSIYNPSI